MQDILQQLRILNVALNAGASSQQIAEAQQTLDCTFPEDLAALYRDHNGMPEGFSNDLFHLMSLEEALELVVDTDYIPWQSLGFRAFWTDDNSNYAALYLSGPLIGRVCFMDHEEETGYAPSYRSLRSFYKATLDSEAAGDDGASWYEMPADYPEYSAKASPEEAASDWSLVQNLLPAFEAAQTEEDRFQFAARIMALTPMEHTETLFRFVRDANMYIQETACEILGRRKFAEAIPLLAEVAENGQNNGRIEALAALGRINTPASREQLERLASTLPDNYAEFARKALKGRIRP